MKLFDAWQDTEIILVVRAEANSSTTVEGVELAFVATTPALSSSAWQIGVIDVPAVFFQVFAKLTVTEETLDPVVTIMLLSSPATAVHPVPHEGAVPPVM